MLYLKKLLKTYTIIDETVIIRKKIHAYNEKLI